MEGAFYYPKCGFGMIIEKLREYCGEQNIRLNARINKVIHDGERITGIEVNGIDTIRPEQVVSTLPISLLIRMLEPKPPGELLASTERLDFRNIILVVLFINRPSITEYGTIYFPSKEYPFTRVSEPRNRSKFMSPQGKTSLIVEVPCDRNDEIWNSTDEVLLRIITSKLSEIGWISNEDIIDHHIQRINYAYPILKLGYEETVDEILSYLRVFKNLRVSGRNGLYTFSSFHHQMNAGKAIVGELKDSVT